MHPALISGVAVAVGGAVGAVARYAVVALMSGGTAAAEGGIRFPWGVLAVNLTGCLLIGMLAGVFVGRPADDRLRLLLATGFLGSFTTFSAFGLDTVELVRAGRVGLAAANAAVQVVLGAGLVAIGWWLARRIAEG